MAVAEISHARRLYFWRLCVRGRRLNPAKAVINVAVQLHPASKAFPTLSCGCLPHLHRTLRSDLYEASAFYQLVRQLHRLTEAVSQIFPEGDRALLDLATRLFGGQDGGEERLAVAILETDYVHDLVLLWLCHELSALDLPETRHA